MKIARLSAILTLSILSSIGCRTMVVSTWVPSDTSQGFSTVRVLLSEATNEEKFKSSGTIEVLDANDLIIKKAYEFVSLDPTLLKAPVKITSNGDYLEYKGSRYRGIIEIKPTNGKVLIINIVNLEQYLMAVVPSEVPASWPMEALKAQAVCARTYVIREMLARKKQMYDVDTTTNTQVYLGMTKENQNTTRAVSDTQGLILLHNGAPIQSFFHSNSGGITEDPQNVWGNKVEYLKSVRSDYDKEGENYSWEEKISPAQITTSLSSLGLGEIQDIVVVNRFTTSRVNEIDIIGTKGSKRIKGTELRKLLGAVKLKSTRFGIRREDDGNFFVKGLGSGHGVGLSQWGSYAMAKENFNYREILNHYYKGIDFARMSQN
ncbi:SpoIID/LytB domain-containing protein [Leptospira ognonensis]|uniref:SpoIID/LytB domain-containing protein n=1 Tax=Leptospira ognonensis TaxID=2484945 RepID=A0A4R9JZW6_9LEPT|nr:SpoIID/LytB domain-containing protein [Leptospira ognonensis]TGL57948.1 SpoIID/LytB domain-containing protein [Leptospira ognonensis]